jgi:Monoamine oxidase
VINLRCNRRPCRACIAILDPEELVDLTQAEFSELKMIAIQELAMGSNSKLNLQFDSRPWVALRCNGETYSDRGYQASWEVTRAQSGAAGILVDYTGGQVADTFATGTPEQHAAEFLAQIEPVLPGLSSQWNGRAQSIGGG